MTTSQAIGHRKIKSILVPSLLATLFSVSLLIIHPGTAVAAPPSWLSPPVASTGFVRFDWKDEKRDRVVPVKIYYPKEGKNLPIIVFSHGLGGTREGYSYLGEHWAGHGLVVVHIQHPGSDDSVWRGSRQPMVELKRAAADLQNSINRPLDVRFVLDEIEKLNRDSSLFSERLNLLKVGVAGHSFGAYTALASSGQVFGGYIGPETKVADPRISAAIIMSAPVTARRDPAQSYGKLKLPCLFMTGTADTSPINETTPEQRRIPFDHAPPEDKFLLTFQGGDHAVFSGPRRLIPDGPQKKEFYSLILASSTAFWEAYLKGNAEAQRWLEEEDGFSQMLGKSGTFEIK